MNLFQFYSRSSPPPLLPATVQELAVLSILQQIINSYCVCGVATHGEGLSILQQIIVSLYKTQGAHLDNTFNSIVDHLSFLRFSMSSCDLPAFNSIVDHRRLGLLLLLSLLGVFQFYSRSSQHPQSDAYAYIPIYFQFYSRSSPAAALAWVGCNLANFQFYSRSSYRPQQ